ncbi:ACP S-malonyltransferase [Sorangium sp. So ce590]|uniref:ACP S-malonyltransferase n=1 Tax=Sorangium sp. So ce590 TaxID=3133317 RepID=UPI003F647C96
MTTIYVFPGQGSQSIGMGKELFPKYPHLIRLADATLGWSVEELCLKGPIERLNNTRFTQPALYVVNALAYLQKVRETGVVPDLLAGHSLGEYNALFAAGAFDFLTGLELVKMRGALMGEVSCGGMAAVMGMAPARIKDVLATFELGAIDIANFNSPEQIVISGLQEDLRAAKPILEREGARMVVPLKVSAAFHSRYMADAGAQFAEFLSRHHFSRLKITVISNLRARPHEEGEIAEALAKHITHPVRWTQSVQYLLGHPSPEFHEVGPGRVLSGLFKQIQQSTMRAQPVEGALAS